MATYDVNKLVKLDGLKQLAERVKDECASQDDLTKLDDTVTQLETGVDALEGKVETLESAEGEKNVIIGVKVNDEDAIVGDDRIIKITVPKDTKELTNSAGFQNATEVETAVTNGINAWAEKATANETIDTFKELVEYVADHQNVAAQLVSDAVQAKTDIAKNTGDISTNTSDIAELKELVGDDSVSEQIEEALDCYVQKEENKGLSTNDYTVADKAKVDAIVFAEDGEVTAMLDEVFNSEG